jgi:hypothetical protein
MDWIRANTVVLKVRSASHRKRNRTGCVRLEEIFGPAMISTDILETDRLVDQSNRAENGLSQVFLQALEKELRGAVHSGLDTFFPFTTPHADVGARGTTGVNVIVPRNEIWGGESMLKFPRSGSVFYRFNQPFFHGLSAV